MTQSEEDIITALIVQLVFGNYTDRGERKTTRATENSARQAAKKILECGFSMASRPVDDRQDQEIDDLQGDVEQLRGWSGLPPELRRHA